MEIEGIGNSMTGTAAGDLSVDLPSSSRHCSDYIRFHKLSHINRDTLKLHNSFMKNKIIC